MMLLTVVVFRLVIMLLLAVGFAKLVAVFTVRELRKEKAKDLASRMPQPLQSKPIDLNQFRERT
jgi:hypothetical protein